MNQPPGLLVLALDGATFDVLDPLLAEGRLPTLARLCAEGQRAPLPSVVPPVTFPAWTSFLTGLDPSEHGIFDFTQKVEGAYRLRFNHAGHRRGETLIARAGREGRRVLVLGLPATYPPEPVEGLLVCGFDAPVSTGSDPRQASDPGLYREIEARAGPWMRPDLDEAARGSDFHERALSTLLERIGRKERFAVAALDLLRRRHGRRPELCMVVFSESDTVGHHYWRDHDPHSPRHDPGAPAARREAIRAVMERLDAACAGLVEAYGPEATCVVLSDHGMGGASRRVVHLNRFLEERGYLVRRPGRAGTDRAARRLRDAALGVLPPALALALFRRARGAAARLESAARFGGIDWSRTRAFSEEANTFPGIWLNLEGREARGCVPAAQREALCQALVRDLDAWRLPADGGGGTGPVVARTWRREELYRGPLAGRAPDLVLELALDRGYGLSLVPTPGDDRADTPSVRTLPPEEWGGGRGRGMNGTHRPDGIWIARAAPGGPPLAAAPGGLVEVAPWLLARLGIGGGLAPEAGPTPREYSPEEQARVAARLRALGYLE